MTATAPAPAPDTRTARTYQPYANPLWRRVLLNREAAVIALWGRCGLLRPWNDPRKDIRRKLHVQPELFLVGVREGEVVATVMAGYEGHRGWVNYLAVAPEQQQSGVPLDEHARVA